MTSLWDFFPPLQVAVGAADLSSAWHFLTEEKIPRNGIGLGAGDEMGLDAAYLVSVVVEQALTFWRAARKADVDQKKLRWSCFPTTVDKKDRGWCLTGRHRRRPRDTASRDVPELVRQLLCDVYTDATATNIAGDSELVRFVLGRLHAVADSLSTEFSLCWRPRPRVLARPMSLFLRQLYEVSHRTCWHLEEWRRRRDRDELRSLGAFTKVLCRDSAQPTEALMDAIQKGK